MGCNAQKESDISSANGQCGYTYLALLLVVAIMGAAMAAAGTLWHTAQMREKERELLYVGDQYRKAIQLYHVHANQYPRELAHLLKDPRTADVQRYLRKLYRDPVTGKNEWGIIKAPDGGIAGVYSLSDASPLKTANFPKDYPEFEGKTKYSEWKFVYAVSRTPTASQKPVPPPPPSPSPDRFLIR